jgi:hypothetical protein
VEATLLGDNDFYSATPAESIAISMYLLFSVVFGAYIIGKNLMIHTYVLLSQWCSDSQR